MHVLNEMLLFSNEHETNNNTHKLTHEEIGISK